MRETYEATKGRMQVKDTKGSIPITAEKGPWAGPFRASLPCEALLKEIGVRFSGRGEASAASQADRFMSAGVECSVSLRKGSKLSDTKYMKTI